MRRFVFSSLMCALVMAAAGLSHAQENWPIWRGPTGMGFVEGKVPTEWDGKSGKNIKWKVPLEVQGNSTPVIWGDKIFLTQANKGGTTRSILCFAKADGKKLWQKDVSYEEKERNWNDSWYANASPAVDGKHVVVSFASAGMYCYDFDGNELWKRTDFGHWTHAFGSGSSPIIYGDLAILWCGPNEKGMHNKLRALDKTTGKSVWEHEEKEGSWGTPVITKIEGKDQLLLAAGNAVKGYDPKSGEVLWSCDGLESYVYTSPLYANGVVVAMSGYTKAALAVKLGGTGDITGQRLWHHKKNIQRVGSGMIIGDHVYMMEENGVPHCYELLTGNEVWKVETRPGGGNTWGSMIHADGRLFVLMRNGDTQMFAASPKYEYLGVNSLGNESTNSTIIASNGELFIRTFSSLWCVSEKK